MVWFAFHTVPENIHHFYRGDSLGTVIFSESKAHINTLLTISFFFLDRILYFLVAQKKTKPVCAFYFTELQDCLIHQLQ